MKDAHIYDGAAWQSLKGPPGPSTPSANAGNITVKGSDSLLFTPPQTAETVTFKCASGGAKPLKEAEGILQLYAGCSSTQPLDGSGGPIVGDQAIAAMVVEYLRVLPDGTAWAFDPKSLSLIVDTAYELSNTVTIPLSGVVDAIVEWGDGSPPTTVKSAGLVTHTYAKDGRYQVAVYGKVGWYGSATTSHPNSDKIVACLSWGSLGIDNLSNGFIGCSRLVAVPTRLPAGTLRLAAMFARCTIFNQPLSDWDTSRIEDFSYMFQDCRAFNHPVSGFDTSKAKNLTGMFQGASTFNQPIFNFDTSSATDMTAMFANCTAFSQDVSRFNTTKAASLQNFFRSCSAFNQDISGFVFSGINVATGLNGFGQSTTIATTNIDKAMIAWNSRKAACRTDLTLELGNSRASASGGGVAARDALRAYGWTINMGTDLP